MKYSLLLFLFVFSPFFSIGQSENCPCCSPAHEEFDFWLGEWEVFNERGENLIEKLEDNCILSENWTGEKGGSGKSYNYYNPADSTWNQL